MKKVAFIGSYDKADLILYVAKVLTILGNKVLIVDATALQKTRYTIPTITPAKQYVTTFEKIDVAIGFENFEQIKKSDITSIDDDEQNTNDFNYDIALVNIDSYKGYCNFKIGSEDVKFFITSLDVYCLRRGLQVLKKIQEPIEVKKVIFSKDMIEEEEKYIDYLASELNNVKWDEDLVFFPFENGDQTALFINQRSERIQLGGLSKQYKEGIAYIVENISDRKSGEIKKAIKVLEKN